MTGTAATFPDRDTVADKLVGMTETDQAFLRLLMENASQDENLLDGLFVYLDRAAGARLLNVLKLEKAGEWLGNNAPARLQVRLMEAARSGQHPAYQAFRTGLVRSGGLERSFPKA